MKAIWRGQVIAESDRTLEVGGYRYFPRETVRMDLLQAAPKTQSDLACPNGVQFYGVTDGAAQSRRAPGPTRRRVPACSRSITGSPSGRTSRSSDRDP
jgi:Domain of unknown function (DUF427)